MSKNLIIILLLILIFIAAAALAFFHFFLSGPSKHSGVEANVEIGGTTFKSEVASTILQRTIGLSGRDSLPEGEGMLFIFNGYGNYGFWMKDMKFPIDMVWISGDKVVGFVENAMPEPDKTVFGLKVYYPPEAVDKVLEINAGDVGRYGISVGQSVLISD
ncbi:MAG: DUF192 domain-containing protein [Patescibacteria group bacterium]|nr:DUF192 domain-containing protein [Patescibacteria group bacterium]MDE2015408.1 DUF192 domain-containing protein [Patescibacteria group bacterium]MDE2226977.1 DUF192 domain-containing protein [Patescibacteria group bacterium]